MMTPLRVTRAEIAEVAGVPVTSVSLAMRNHVRLPPAARKRHQHVAKNWAARRIR